MVLVIGSSGFKHKFKDYVFDRRNNKHYFIEDLEELKKDINIENDEDRDALAILYFYLKIMDVTNLGKNYEAILNTKKKLSGKAEEVAKAYNIKIVEE